MFMYKSIFIFMMENNLCSSDTFSIQHHFTVFFCAKINISTNLVYIITQEKLHRN